ncbi:MAG: NAD(P)H-quinone oxidoreductase [Pseudomonadota bacterium]|nr:NAD(P)H-quinone oxidoreductase [Pseudomonadota bacterium]
MKDLMRAVSIREPGGPEVLQTSLFPLPWPGPDDVLVRVRAAGVNRPDVLQRLGDYPVPADADPLPGLEIAGEVVSTGDDARRWKPGDRVMALTHGGGYAEFCRVNEMHCLPVPAPLSMVEAAAIPETFFTVWYNVFTRGRLAEAESILVHGGSSGIGTTAIQLCKSFGATVIVTAGSDEKCRFCEDLGADYAINYRSTDWEASVTELRGQHGVDIVLDMVAGDYMQKNMNVLARDGRYLIIAFLAGPVATLDMRQVLMKRLTITGSTLRPQSTAEKSTIASNLAENVLPLLESGEVKPVIHSTFPLADAALAHELMESSAHMGKIVLTLPE